jgi:hypothetical protein
MVGVEIEAIVGQQTGDRVDPLHLELDRLIGLERNEGGDFARDERRRVKVDGNGCRRA